MLWSIGLGFAADRYDLPGNFWRGRGTRRRRPGSTRAGGFPGLRRGRSGSPELSCRAGAPRRRCLAAMLGSEPPPVRGPTRGSRFVSRKRRGKIEGL